MADSKYGLDTMAALLAGNMTGAQLETSLGLDDNKGFFALTLDDPVNVDRLLKSVDAAEALCESSLAIDVMNPFDIAKLFETPSYAVLISDNADSIASVLNNDQDAYNAIKNNATAYANFNARVNTGSSKLLRTTLTTSGTWTVHTGNTLKALALAIHGGGGAGGASINTASPGSGGGGAELAVKRIAVADLPSSNVSYTIGIGSTFGGASATASSFGALLSADPGGDSTTVVVGVGGGTDSNTSDDNVDLDIPNVGWQGNLTETTHQGPNGGSASAPGGNNYNGNGGGLAGTNPVPQGGEGTAPAAAGGGGYQTTGYDGFVGKNAASPDYGAAGGGGAKRATAGTNNGGNGFAGSITVYYVDAA